MACVVCGTEKIPYKCPTCSARYCSVKCYKQHKVECVLVEKTATNSDPPALSNIPDNNSHDRETGSADSVDYEELARDPKVSALLKSRGLQQHLRLIARILDEPSLSGENSEEGRRIVALKKLRELRKGGRENNEGVEQFSERVIELVSSK